MKYTRFFTGVLVFFMLTALTAGCSKPVETQEPTVAPVETTGIAPTKEAGEPVSTEIVITDMAGREIKLDRPAEKVVALTAADCEILYAIGAGSTLVGRGEYCNFPEEVSAIPSIHSGYETNIEQIIALAPQVVLMSIMSQSKEQVAALENAGIKVVASNVQDIAGVYTAIELTGAVTGKNDEAAKLIAQMKAVFEEVIGKAKSDGSKTIYFEVSPLEYGLWTAGGGTFMDEMAAMLGLTNAFEDVAGWAEISQEQVIERDPDYIVTIAMYFGEGMTPVEEIKGRDGWQDMKAIKNNRVMNADSDEISIPGPRLTNAISTLYNFVYEREAQDAAQ